MENLPADVLYQISLALAGQPVNLQDKLNNAKQIINLCKVNKRFNQIYCKDDRIWKELWLKDISTILPSNNIKDKYITVLKEVNEYWGTELIQHCSKYGYDIILKNILENRKLYPLTLYNALVTASENGQLNIVKLLLDYDPELGDIHETALFKAVQGGYFEIVKYLVEHGADVHIFDDYIIEEAENIYKTKNDENSKRIYEYLISL